MRSTWRDEQPRTALRHCDHPGCTGAGEYRAPKARDRLEDYYWFCLDHVRQYNASWDYYRGMSADQIEDEIRRDTTWQRPSWKLGTITGRIHDPLGLFEEEGRARQEARRRSQERAMSPEQKAMRVLDLAPPLTIEQLKKRYKELVKQHHPDLHGGDKDAEERFKEINQAYKLLRGGLTTVA